MISLEIDFLFVIPFILLVFFWGMYKLVGLLFKEENYCYGAPPSSAPPIWEWETLHIEDNGKKFTKLPYGAYGIDIYKRRKK